MSKALSAARRERRRLARRGADRVPLLGAHLSIAGGHWRAVLAAAELGCDTVQLFTKNNNQWRAKPLAERDVERFAEAIRSSGVREPTAHACYLLNLASPERRIWRKSVATLAVELGRCAALGIKRLVLHPGSHMGAGPERGLRRVAAAIEAAYARAASAKGGMSVQVVLELTAGQGTCVGWQFEQLAEIIGAASVPVPLGVCFDTCHAFAAGYAFGTVEEYDRTMAELAGTIGFERLAVLHLNDSRRERGSRVDRHEHIGHGRIGLAAFKLLLADPRMRAVPKYIETPKETRDGEDMDRVNLQLLHRLAAGD